MKSDSRRRHREAPRKPSARRVERVMQTLACHIDGTPPARGRPARGPAMELPAVEKISKTHRGDPFKILIGTLLSARTQDATTHAASSRLFRAARTPKRMAALSVREIEELIYPVGFYRNKARFVQATAHAIVARHGGRVPRTLDQLVTLPGVGRKTANLVMILAFQSDANICVDTHVHRISNRIGWVKTREPNETETALYAATERRWWPLINLYLVTWGQNVCRPISPRCGECAIASDCQRVGVMRGYNSR